MRPARTATIALAAILAMAAWVPAGAHAATRPAAAAHGCAARGRTFLANRYVRVEGGHDTAVACNGTVAVYDATSRRARAHELATNAVSNRPGEVTSLVTTSGGWVAWLGFSPTEDALEVWALPPSGAARRIDAAVHVHHDDPARDSLAASSDRIFWQFGADARSRLLR